MTNATPIDITSFPELAHIVEEVEATRTPRKLVLHNKPVAVISPVPAKKQREKTKADYEAFRAATGSWKEVDTDTLLKNIYEDRRRTNTRPPVKL